MSLSLSISASSRSFPLTGQQSSGASASQPKSTEDEFLKIAKQSPIERMRSKILEDMKVTEDDIAKMTPTERQAVEDEIKKHMMEALNASPGAGAVVDKTA